MRCLVLAALCLSACSTDTDADISESDVSAEQALAAVLFPADWVVLTTFMVLAEDPCPAISQTDDATLITGDCTDEDGGVWVGSVTITDETDAGSYNFDAFGQQGQFQFDGEMVGTSSGSLVVNGTVTADAFDTFWTYEDLTYTDIEGWLAARFVNGGTSDISGTIDLNGTTLDVSGSVSNAQDTDCADEFDDGSVTVTGGTEPIVYSWTEDACDGCADYVQGDASGTVCLD